VSVRARFLTSAACGIGASSLSVLLTRALDGPAPRSLFMRWLAVFAEHPARSALAITLLALAFRSTRFPTPRQTADGSTL